MTTRSATDPQLLDTETVAPGGWQRRTTLRDGTAVLLRQIRPQDSDQLAAGMRALSPASRYLRFHEDLAELTPAQLAYLTEVDHVDHEAIVAIDLDRPEPPGIGVARFIRDPFEREVAEAVVTVADSYQGRGAATLLLGALAARAREEGIEVFRHYVLTRNAAMLEVFDHLGATRELEADGLWRVDLPLPKRARDLPDSPAGRAFMAAAKAQFRLADLVRPVHRLLPCGPASNGADVVAWEVPDEGDGDLARWLADRDQRGIHWPAAMPSERPPQSDEAHDAGGQAPVGPAHPADTARGPSRT
jgi:RimJ/RimL family protein N-acetyltransferase